MCCDKVVVAKVVTPVALTALGVVHVGGGGGGAVGDERQALVAARETAAAATTEACHRVCFCLPRQELLFWQEDLLP